MRKLRITKTLKLRMILFAVLSLFFVAFSFLGQGLDNKCRDRFFHMRPSQIPNAGVVLWNLDPISERAFGIWPYSNDVLSILAQYIVQANPAQVIIEHSAEELVGTGLLPETLIIQEAGPMFMKALRPDSDGLYRNFPVEVGLPGLTQPSLAVTAASRINKDASATWLSPIQIRKAGRLVQAPVNFSGIGVRYPTVQIFKLIEGQIRPETFTGKTIIIGKTQSDAVTGLFTPLRQGNEAMPRIEYLAESITTLAAGHEILKMPFGIDLIVVWLFGIYLFFSLPRRSFIWELSAAFFGSLVYFLVQFTLFAAFNISGHVAIPPVFWGLCAIGSLIVRLTGAGNAAKEMVSSFSFRNEDLTFLPHVNAGEEIWESLSRLGSIYIAPDAQVFFSYDPKTNQVVSKFAQGRRVPEGYECSDSLNSPPFVDASRRNNPMETAIPGLLPGPVPYASYLIPLRVKGNLVGFWGCVLQKPIRSINKPILRRITVHLADEMQRLLTKQQSENPEQTSIWSNLAQEDLEDTINSMNGLVRSFEQNERFFKYTFANMADGVVIFGLSGEIIYFNDSATKSLRTFSMGTTEPDFFEVLRTVSHARPEIFRKRLLALISGAQSLNFEAEGAGGQVFSVSVSPIVDERSTHPIAMICKIMDVTELIQHRKLKNKVLKSFFSAMKQLMLQIQQTGEFKTGPPATATEVGKRLVSIRRKIRRVINLVDRFEQVTYGPAQKDLTLVAPLELSELVRQIVSAKQSTVDPDEVLIEAELPEGELLVMGNRKLLTKLMDTLLDLSISHSIEGGDIWISAETEKDRVVLYIEDSGFGFPQEYANNLSGESVLGEMEAALEQVGGSLKADSNLGQGTRFEIKLPKVI